MPLSNKLKNLPSSESVSPNDLQRVTKSPPNFPPDKLNRLNFLISTVWQVFRLDFWCSCLNIFHFFSVIFGSWGTRSRPSCVLIPGSQDLLFNISSPHLQKLHSSDGADYSKNPHLDFIICHVSYIRLPATTYHDSIPHPVTFIFYSEIYDLAFGYIKITYCSNEQSLPSDPDCLV